MYSRLTCILMLLFIFLSNGCQKLPTDTGEATAVEEANGLIYWGGEYNDEGMAVVQTFDGGYAVAGSKYSATSQKDLVLAKFNSQLEYEKDTTAAGPNGTFNNSANALYSGTYDEDLYNITISEFDPTNTKQGRLCNCNCPPNNPIRYCFNTTPNNICIFYFQ